MKRLSNSLKVFGAFALLAVIIGCASTPPAGPSPESLLAAAGFKTVVASTDKQLQHLPTLPAGEVTVIDRTGKTFYVYPDVAKNQLYVGTEKEYRAYQKLRVQNNMPAANPEASYFKQDKALQKADVRDTSAWDVWPAFSILEWQ